MILNIRLDPVLFQDDISYFWIFSIHLVESHDQLLLFLLWAFELFQLRFLKMGYNIGEIFIPNLLENLFIGVLVDEVFEVKFLNPNNFWWIYNSFANKCYFFYEMLNTSGWSISSCNVNLKRRTQCIQLCVFIFFFKTPNSALKPFNKWVIEKCRWELTI